MSPSQLDRRRSPGERAKDHPHTEPQPQVQGYMQYPSQGQATQGFEYQYVAPSIRDYTPEAQMNDMSSFGQNQSYGQEGYAVGAPQNVSCSGQYLVSCSMLRPVDICNDMASRQGSAWTIREFINLHSTPNRVDYNLRSHTTFLLKSSRLISHLIIYSKTMVIRATNSRHNTSLRT
jgi:hypothetical protein